MIAPLGSPVGGRFVDLHRAVGRGQAIVCVTCRLLAALIDSAAICTALMIPW